MGSDLSSITSNTVRILFQSTLPAWGATKNRRNGNVYSNISIHAPRMGSDNLNSISLSMLPYFNPRSPHGERRRELIVAAEVRDFNPRSPHGERQWLHHRIHFLSSFQSTLPAWGATRSRTSLCKVSLYFNPRSPHGERPPTGCIIRKLITISIHAPRMGSDREI